jgi:hypothetical protein
MGIQTLTNLMIHAQGRKTCTSCLKSKSLFFYFSPIQDVVEITLQSDLMKWLKKFIIKRIDDEERLLSKDDKDLNQIIEDSINTYNDILKQIEDNNNGYR